MKRYTLSFADAVKHEPKNPDRTARRWRNRTTLPQDASVGF